MSSKGSVLVLGAGLVSGPFIHYMSEHGYDVIVGSRTLESTKKVCEGAKLAKPVEIDIETEEGKKTLDEWAKKVDAIISLLPYVFHPEVAQYALKYNKHFLTTSYESDKMKALAEEAKKKGLVFINECGVDPGTDHMSAMRIIDDIRKRGGHISSFTSYCGGLPAPDDNDNPLGYKLSWAPRGVLLASKNTATFLKDGKKETIPGEVLFDNYKIFSVPEGGEFEGYPNRDSTVYKGVYGIDKTQTLIRGTFRNKGWCAQIKKLVDLGYLSLEEKDLSKSTYAQVLAGLLSLKESDAASLKKAVAAKFSLKEDDQFIKTMEWLSLFSDEKIPAKVNTVLDALCEQMKKKMQYKPGERDMLAMHHIFRGEFPDGSKEEWTSTLLAYGIKNGETAMSRLVSLPVAIACRLVLEKKFAKPGLFIPTIPELYNPILDELEEKSNSSLLKERRRLNKHKS